MTFVKAKKLHNGDEVAAKDNGEVIKVHQVKVLKARTDGLRPMVEIKGTGSYSGWNSWIHVEVA
jgi:hypothetical protein